MPATMAMVVIMMGRARLLQASMIASVRDRPCSRRAITMYSTSRMEFLVTMPISVSRPIREGNDSSMIQHPQHDYGATCGRRQRRQDGDRLQHVVEQQHQQRVDAEYADDHGEDEAAEDPAQDLGITRLHRPHTGRQVLHGWQFVHDIRGIAQRNGAAVRRDA